MQAPLLPADIKWHMIGHVTSSNVKNLLKVANLSVVEAIDSEKLAKRFDTVLESEKVRSCFSLLCKDSF